MIYAQQSTVFDTVFESATPGLVGTVGFRILASDGTTSEARTTAGITELAAGSGIYQATPVAPAEGGEYTVMWDTGGVSPQFAVEELTVTAGPPPQPAGPFYTSPQQVREALSVGGAPDLATASGFDDAQLNDAILDAQSEVDAKVPGDPFPPDLAPQLVQNLTRDLAAYLATLTQRRGDPLDPNDPVRLRYQRANSILDAIAAGRIEIGGGTTGEQDVAAVVNQYDGALWDLDSMLIGPAPNRAWPWGQPYFGGW